MEKRLFFKNSPFKNSELKNSQLKKQTPKHRVSQLGFTLIEIMIVLVILGGLMAILGGKMVGALNKARQKEAYIQIKELSKQLDAYNIDCTQYPTTEQGLQALVQNPGSEACPNWGPEPYSKNVPKDPWGTSYAYESDGSKFIIKSYGKDRKPGGSGYDRDISSDDDDQNIGK